MFSSKNIKLVPYIFFLNILYLMGMVPKLELTESYMGSFCSYLLGYTLVIYYNYFKLKTIGIRHIRLAYKLFFFSQRTVFFSQQISQQYFQP